MHSYALATSVTKVNMLNYYRSTAMEGCIRNVPRAVTNKRKAKVEDDLDLMCVFAMCCIVKRRRMQLAL